MVGHADELKFGGGSEPIFSTPFPRIHKKYHFMSHLMRVQNVVRFRVYEGQQKGNSLNNNNNNKHS